MLKQCLEELNEIPNINKGGCAVVSYYLYKHLPLKDSKIIFMYTDPFDLLVSASIEDGLSCSHSAIYYNDELWDSEGVSNFEKFPIKIEVPIEKVRESIANKEIWNPTFDRKNIMKIVRIIKKYSDNWRRADEEN